MKSRTAIVFLVLVSLLIAPAAAAAAEDPNRGGSLVVAVAAEPDTFDPHKAVAAVTEEIDFNVYEGLLGFDTGGGLTPALAQSWEVSDDGSVFTFWLRPDTYFHNGQLVTAEDVVYSFERIQDPQTAFPQNWPQSITRVEAIDAHTVRITTDGPMATLLYYLPSVAVIPAGSGPTIASNPVGTGPFRFVEWRRNQHVRLRRFENYWNPDLPYLDEVTFRIIPDINTALINLRTGNVDVIPRLEPELADQVEADPNLKLLTGPMNLVQLMAINNAREPFSDVRVRKAINYAVDKDEIIYAAAWGYGTKLGSNLSPVSEVFYKDLSNYYKPDLEKARSLLAEAGYPNGFTATLSLPSPWELHKKTGELIAAQLARAGIDLRIEIVEWGTWLERIYKNRNYDLTVIGFTGKLDPHIALERYASDYPRNFINFSNPEFDRLMKEGKVETDPEKRVEIYKRAQEILAEQAASVYIMDPSAIVAMRNTVQGWRLYPLYVDDVSRVWLKP